MNTSNPRHARRRPAAWQRAWACLSTAVLPRPATRRAGHRASAPRPGAVPDRGPALAASSLGAPTACAAGDFGDESRAPGTVPGERVDVPPPGCGWFDSSHELRCGLRVIEHPVGAPAVAGLPLSSWLALHLANWHGDALTV